jgi:aspartate kinase
VGAYPYYAHYYGYAFWRRGQLKPTQFSSPSPPPEESLAGGFFVFGVLKWRGDAARMAQNPRRTWGTQATAKEEDQMAPEANERQSEGNEERRQNGAALRNLDRSSDEANELQRSNRVRVMKFGGSVMASADNILLAARHVAEAARNERIAVVVSALRGVTDRLYSVTRALRLRDEQSALSEAQEIAQFHLHIARELYSGDEQEFQLRIELAELSLELSTVVSGGTEGHSPAEVTDEVVSFGERWSSRLFAAALRRIGVNADALDAFHFIVTDGDREDPHPKLAESYPKIHEALYGYLEAGTVPVVTGFVAATPEGRITTLGRNSSDFSAAIVACALRAHDLTIWTSVDGFFDADPNHVPSAQQFEELSYEEALEHSQRGARVVHPKAFDFLMQERIPLLVRNAARPDAPGTWIGLREIGRQSAASGGSR